MKTTDFSVLENWVGKTEETCDVAASGPIARLAATLDLPPYLERAGNVVPLPWHWIFFNPETATARLGVDGHSPTGDFLPPVPLPRRMWAGSRITAGDVQIELDDRLRRTSTISSVTHKQGATGPLVFVKVRHDIDSPRGHCLTEEQDIVYRDQAPKDSAPPPGKPAPTESRWQRDILPSPPLLFRYSALTFNTHRIHYDRPYATEVEGYSGLVVHGPLVATLLLDLVYRSVPNIAVKRFSFRALRPLLDSSPFSVCASPRATTPTVIDLWTRDSDGFVTTEATVEF